MKTKEAIQDKEEEVVIVKVERILRVESECFGSEDKEKEFEGVEESFRVEEVQEKDQEIERRLQELRI